jgi:hypothetical protein
MSRRRVAAWLLSFPLMVVGSQVAHVFAYRWVYPNAHVRLSELLSTGHRYMGSSSYVPLLLGLLFAAEFVGVGWVFAGSVRRSLQRPVPAWAFALLPMLGFTFQEFIERWLSGAPFPWWMVLQPTFRIGLLLQIPFALLAFLVAKLLLRVADRAGRSLRAGVARPSLVGVSHRWVVLEVVPPRRGVLASGRSGRGPPRAVAAVITLAHQRCVRAPVTPRLIAFDL